MNLKYRFATQHIPQLVGFDRIFNQLEEFATLENQPKYPPYNVKSIDGEKYVIEMATAGFKRDELNIVSQENQLTISADRRDTESVGEGESYLHRGLANRSFSHTFKLADDVIVRGADYADGILTVSLERIIPEEKKPRRIEIGATQLNSIKPELLTEAKT